MDNINKLEDEKIENYTNFILSGDEYIEYETRKRCSNKECRRYLLLDEFNKSSHADLTQLGVQTYCKECQSKQYRNMSAVIYKVSFKSINDYIVEYYGKTSVDKQRERDHKSKLKCGTHGNLKLQYEFNKLADEIGLEEAFKSIKFEIIVEVDKDMENLDSVLLEMEKQVNDTRIKEVKDDKLNIKVVS